MSSLLISGKAIGARKPLFADWSIPVPPEWSNGDDVTLRDLIDKVVRTEVKAFRERQEDHQVFRTLTARQIAAGAEKGKIEMGGREVPLQEVEEDQAVAVACQAFEDGIYLVIIDDQQQRELDRQVFLQPDSRVTFVRLTLLAGG